MTLRIDTIMDNREFATFRLIMQGETVDHTIDASALVGSSATLGNSELLLKSIDANISGTLGVLGYNETETTSNYMFAMSNNETTKTFMAPIGNGFASRSSDIRIELIGATGFAYITFVKNRGFENTGRQRRKPNRPNSYS